MHHPLYDVVNFSIVEPYTLRIAFDDGAERTINFESVLYGEMFGPLRDLQMFNQVRLDEEVRTLVWPNGADFDPWTLYEWHRFAEALAKRARAWETT